MNGFFDGSITKLASPVSRLMDSIDGPEHRPLQGPLSIGIVNNMPDSALIATERQFVRLVQTAAQGVATIRLFHIPGVPRSEEARRILAERYEPISSLYASRIDALVVTGNEPRAPRLDEEPYWPELTKLVDWARQNTRTTLWSCLAAHAAVLHLDGIERCRLPQKKSGVLICRANGGASEALPSTLSVCHSRMNEVRKGDLLQKGYDILSETADCQVDVFSRELGSSFLFLQGHPEYEPDSLMREYRRDVGRFLNGQQQDYPGVPENYFDNETTLRMENYRTRAERTRDIRMFESFPQVSLRHGLEARLAESAAAIFSSWVSRAVVTASA